MEGGADPYLLIVYVTMALGVSFLCSIAEAVLLSVTPSYIEGLKEMRASAREGERAGVHPWDARRQCAAFRRGRTSSRLRPPGGGAQRFEEHPRAFRGNGSRD